MVAAGKCYGPWYMARNTPPWPCLIPTCMFLRIHDEERPYRRAEEPCSCATRKWGPAPISHRSFSSLWSVSSLLPEILHYSGNPCISSAIPVNLQISFSSINIYILNIVKQHCYFWYAILNYNMFSFIDFNKKLEICIRVFFTASYRLSKQTMTEKLFSVSIIVRTYCRRILFFLTNHERNRRRMLSPFKKSNTHIEFGAGKNRQVYTKLCAQI